MPASRRADPLVSARDLLGVGTLALVHVIATALPAPAWRGACRIAAWPLGIWRTRHPSRRGLASGRPEILSARLQTRLLAGELESFVLMARLPRRLDVRLEGRAHLDAAVARGRGAVLWVQRFQPFVHFVALARAGFRVARPSARDHGHFSRSRFGARFLNGFQLGAEARYCERVVLAPGDLAAIRQLSRRLAANQVVSMYADRRGPRSVDLPVLDGVVSVGVGPATLAVHAQAPLLPVFPLADGYRGFRIVIEAPLPISGGRAAVDEGLRSHAPVLERYVKAYPDQWRGWSSSPYGGVTVWRPRSGPGAPRGDGGPGRPERSGLI